MKLVTNVYKHERDDLVLATMQIACCPKLDPTRAVNAHQPILIKGWVGVFLKCRSYYKMATSQVMQPQCACNYAY